MSITKRASGLVTIPEFLTIYSHVTDNQIRWAVRNRKTNGLRAATYREATGKRRLLIDPNIYLGHVCRVVPA